MAQVQFLGHFRGSRVSAEQDDFRAGLQPSPAFQGISLDNPGVSLEGLGNGEYGQGRGFLTLILVFGGIPWPAEPPVNVLEEVSSPGVGKGSGHFLF
jgi:hypothetical protein